MEDRTAKFKSTAFDCPFCSAYSHMHWQMLVRFDDTSNTDIYECKCTRCKKSSYWRQYKKNSTNEFPPIYLGEMIYPDYDPSLTPEQDMPEDVLFEYNEASKIYSKSPRAAAALLRLGLQKLCIHLGGEGKNINTDLRTLASNSILPPEVIQVADTIRITGNQAVHPGEMNPEDVDYIASKMFDLLNYIVRRAITEPKFFKELYGLTPEYPRKIAEETDAKNQQTKKA